MDRTEEKLIVVTEAEPEPARTRKGLLTHDARVAGSAAGLVVAAIVLSGCGQQLSLSAAAPAPQAPSSSAGMPAAQADALSQVVQLAARRAEVSDQVAAAKLGTGQPVTDPEREARVIAAARAAATRTGVDPEWVARVFDDQIAASTLVQNGLLRAWTDDPASQPGERPDLARIRPELDRIGEELVAALTAAAPARAHEACPSTVAEVVTTRAADLDTIHRAALDRALLSICDGNQN
jgi:chorismate mutase